MVDVDPPLDRGRDPNAAVQIFVDRQRRLLDLELRSELDEEENAATTAAAASSSSSSGSSAKNARGAADDGGEAGGRSSVLRGLRVDEATVGLYGRTVMSMVPNGFSAGCVSAPVSPLTPNAEDAAAAAAAGGIREGRLGTILLPAHRLTVGDEVEILSKGRNKAGVRRPPGGVVCAVSESSISIALFDSSSSRGGSSKKSSVGSSGKKGGGKSRGSKAAASGDDEEMDDEDNLAGLSPPLTLIPRSSAEVHRKMKSALDELVRQGTGHPVAGRVVRASFSSLPMAIEKKKAEEEEEEPLDPKLDPTQRSAVSFALGVPGEDRPVSLIHGPPGTGKTTAVVELIRRAVHRRQWRVLVCAPSNVAVDNVLEKLVGKEDEAARSLVGKRSKRLTGSKGRKRIKAVRLGHPARLRPAILPYSLEHCVQSADGTEIVKDVRSELDSYIKVLSNPKSRPSDRRVARREAKLLRGEVRRREEGVVKEVLGGADVVLCTCVGAGSSVLTKLARMASTSLTSMSTSSVPSDAKPDGYFDLVVIDEAAQALESACWIPILRGRRLVLAGDHCQLPPTVLCRSREVQDGLGRTMFERIMSLYGDHVKNGQGGIKGGEGRVSRMLRVQYRMHSSIADWSSGAMYGGSIISHESVRSRRLINLPDFHAEKGASDEEDVVPAGPLLLIDTAGCSHHETQTPSLSRLNRGEANLVARHVRSLLSSGLDPGDVAVISPYNGQVELLRTMLLPSHPGLEIRSVDGFQGGEREAVVLSLVRSSDPSDRLARGGGGKKGGGEADSVGFLRDDRRLNVAITRAKRHCCVVCDSETVSSGGEFLNGVVRWFEEHGEIRSAAEFEIDDDAGADRSEAVGIVVAEAKAPPAGKAGEEEVARLKDEADRTSKAVALVLVAAGGSKAASAKPDATTATGCNVAPSSASEDARRKALMNKISAFAESGRLRGATMVAGTNLSKFDRLVVQELAKQLGLGYKTEGTEGMNQRAVLTVLRDPAKPKVERMGDEGKASVPEAAFAALALDNEDSSDSDDGRGAAAKSCSPAENTLLADLARERMERQQMQQQIQLKGSKPTLYQGEGGGGGGGGGRKKKRKKNKKKKGGGAATTAPIIAEYEDGAADDDLDDDMAFLDSQIERAQNAHGRKVEGRGKGYKSIVNGILNARPPPRDEKRDERAGAALRAKLKKAEDERKVKGGGNKKKKKR